MSGTTTPVSTTAVSTTPVSTANSLSALASTAATTQVGTGANNPQMNQFLQLLTAQLKNQDPTNPTDPTQFVSQLAQFSTVEQLTQSNATLNTISSSLTGLTLGQYSGMINHTVTANTTSVTVPASGSVSSPMTFDVTASGLSNVNVANYQLSRNRGGVPPCQRQQRDRHVPRNRHEWTGPSGGAIQCFPCRHVHRRCGLGRRHAVTERGRQRGYSRHRGHLGPPD